MRYDEFEKEFPEAVAKFKPATRRSYKKRGEVPDRVVAEVRALQNLPVTAVPGVAKSETVAKDEVPVVAETGATLRVAIPSFEKGHPEFDIMSDGWARGLPGDTGIVRSLYRTSAAIRRMAEAKEGQDPRKWVKEWDERRAEFPKWSPENEGELAKKRVTILTEIAGRVK
jgi:hypothetical protein